MKINQPIPIRVLAILVCIVMLAGVMTACFSNEEFVPSTPTTGNGGNDNSGTTNEDGSFTASTTLSDGSLIYGALANGVTVGTTEGYNAIIPADVKIAEGASSVSLSVKPVETDAEMYLGKGDVAQSLDVHIEGIAADNTVPMIVNLGAVLEAGLSDTELKLYHTENGTDVLMTRVNSLSDFSIHNQYYYNAETGEVSIYVSSFSVFVAVETTASKWDENTVADTSWYDAETTEFVLENVGQFLGFRDLVDGGNNFVGKTVKLGVDIDLSGNEGKLFNPIGGGWAYNGGKTFNGTFDGQGHTIYNIRVNGWELDSTDQHSGTSMGAGLFSSVHNATIKNLAVVGADLVVETTSIGIIAGVAQGKCIFENIVVSDATLGNYQMRNGGIVGDIYVIESDNVTEGEYSHIFKNIVVDSSVKISSMWGDFDTGNGGVVGGKYGSAKVLMQNVTVAAEFDVFSDVTAAYQWYAYRRCGMLIGYTGQNSPKQATNAAADFLTCENVNVYYGDWTNYTYYQFNEQDNPTGRRYPWVRAEASPYNNAFSNVRYGVPTFDGVKVSDMDANTLNDKKSDFAAITFNQLYGGGQGVYGCAEHDGVVTNSKTFKTIYIHNNLDWENLRLHYWFANGNDQWTTIIDGISMNVMETAEAGVYKIQLPANVDGFKITADGENESEEFVLSKLVNNLTYTLDGKHASHTFVDNECVCGATQKFELVTDASNLTIGDKIIILDKNSTLALSTTQNSNNRVGVDIVKNNDGTFTINEEVQIIILEQGTINGTFAFNVGDGYLYAASSSANHLKTQDTIKDNGSWTITINDGIASIIANAACRNVMQYNPNNGSPIFSCYASDSQTAVVVYKLVVIEPHDCNTNILVEGTNATCTEDGLTDGAKCDFCGTITKEQETISKTAHTPVIDAAVEPTCTETGLTEGSHCGVCNNVLVAQEEVDALGHNVVNGQCTRCDYVDEAHDCTGGTATCTELAVCEICAKPYGDLKSHDYKDDDNDCTTEKICSACGVIEEGSAKQHVYNSNYVCENCGQKDPSAKWVLVDDIADIKPTDVIVIVWKKSSGTYAITNNNGTGSAPDAVEVTIKDNELSGDIADNIKWNISNSNGTLIIYPNGTTDKWLYCTSANNGVRVGTNTNKTFTIDASSGYLKHVGTSRYLGIYIEQDVRCYTTSTTTNIANQTIEFYKYGLSNSGSEGGETPNPETPCTHVNTTETIVAATCTEAGSITVTCKDCGKTVSTKTLDKIDHSDVNTDDDHDCDACGAEGVTSHVDANGDKVCDNGCGVEITGGSVTTTKTATMSIFANKGTVSGTTISWTSGNVVFKVEKDQSSTAIRTSDTDHFRAYQGSKTTISAPNMTKIVITTTGSSYLTALENSLKEAGFTFTTSDNNVTITFDSPTDSISFSGVAQWRLNKIVITYAE